MLPPYKYLPQFPIEENLSIEGNFEQIESTVKGLSEHNAGFFNFFLIQDAIRIVLMQNLVLKQLNEKIDQLSKQVETLKQK